MSDTLVTIPTSPSGRWEDLSTGACAGACEFIGPCRRLRKINNLRRSYL